MYTDHRGQIYDHQGNPHGGAYIADVFDRLHQQDVRDREARFSKVLSDCRERSQRTPHYTPSGNGTAPRRKRGLGKALLCGIALWFMYCLLSGPGTEKAPNHPAKLPAAVEQTR